MQKEAPHTLHDPAKVVTPPAATTPASTSSTPSTEEVSNRVIRQPLLAAATASPMTLHEVHPTAAVTLWNQQISQPTVCEAFVVVLRYLTDDWELKQCVGRLKLLAKTMTGKEIAQPIIVILSTECGISPI